MKKLVITEEEKKNILEQHSDERQSKEDNIMSMLDQNPKLKDLKQFGLKYNVGSIKNFLTKQLSSEHWNPEHMPFPSELNILNVLIQSRLVRFYLHELIKKRGGNYWYNWEKKIKKEDVDNIPIPEALFNTIVLILQKK
jgi:hypothetical protein